jgi:hypothetical protein
MRKPNFILIGAMKCGTTSLRHNLLRKHPDVYMPATEARFFAYNENYQKGFDWYLSWFDDAKNEKAVGESSGFYAWDSHNSATAQRVAEHLPDAKILYMVRHPIERIVSHWGWEISNGRALGSINEAVERFPRLIEMSLYWRQLSAYRDHFPDEQIKVLFLEDLKNDQHEFLRQCGNFLGVDADAFNREAAATPMNRTEDRRTDTRTLMQIRQWSGFWKLKDHVPQWLKTPVRRLLRTDGKVYPQWDEQVLRRVRERVVPDAERLLDYCGKPADFWKFDYVSLRKEQF